ncbi:hypothetical protein [Clostridium frigidicarnis]|uniref:Uncharacterized protein n=1 Tax=Clostridium frigidicarnis TaxID=84698 RepID=A0A1I0YM86_9CLOT|nr:hypothetical protein [Clostridium frigidicarnis]SFB13243.1 hypothetical protein SAMN04488528_101377 [Clostridium frigidicarnis]
MNKNIEMMKKLIEEKKQKGSNSKNNRKAEKTIGSAAKAVRNKKTGGVFDK